MVSSASLRAAASTPSLNCAGWGWKASYTSSWLSSPRAFDRATVVRAWHVCARPLCVLRLGNSGRAQCRRFGQWLGGDPSRCGPG